MSSRNGGQFIALIVGIIILAGQYFIDKTLQTANTELAYEEALAQAKIEKYEQLWTAIYDYTFSMVSAFTSNKYINVKKGLMNDSIIQLNNRFTEHGIYIGVYELEKIKSNIDFTVLAEANATGDADIIREAIENFSSNNISELKKLERAVTNVEFND